MSNERKNEDFEHAPVEREPDFEADPTENEDAPSAAMVAPSMIKSFLPRAAAFLLDGVLIYLFAQTLDQLARTGLLAFNPWTPWLAPLLPLVYFAMAEGPVGKGQTVGKLLLKLRVVDEGGRPPEWPAAFKRSALKSAVFLITYSFQPDYLSWAFAPGARGAIVLGATMIGNLALVFALTEAMGMAMHPLRRTWHDLWGGSYVIAVDSVTEFSHAIRGPFDPMVERRIVNHLRLTAFFMLIATGVLIYRPVVTYLSDGMRTFNDQVTVLNRTIETSPYRVAGLVLPTASRQKEIDGYIEARRARFAEDGRDVPTTDSLRELPMLDPDALSLVLALRTGGWIDSAGQRATLLAAAEDLRHETRAIWENRERSADDGALPDEPSRFELFLIEPLQVLFYNGMRRVEWVRGPADPAQGPLAFDDSFEDFLGGLESDRAPATEATDHGTTPTATTAPASTRP